MTGDHHGRSARWATLLVRAVAGILGTHRAVDPDNRLIARRLEIEWELALRELF
jgi:hypothetical protein